jgi:hypothetical protein
MLSSVKRWAAVAVLTTVVTAAAWAADASGKWTWTQKRGQNEVTQNLELKQDGEKLTGKIGMGERAVEIKDGSVKDGTVAFTVVRERNGQEFKTVYKGKLDGDTIKGTMTFNRQGQERSVDWTANRAK